MRLCRFKNTPRRAKRALAPNKAGFARCDKRESSIAKRVSQLTKKMGAPFTRKVKVRPDGRQNTVTWSMWCSTFVNAESIVYSFRQGQIISFSSEIRYHVYRVFVKLYARHFSRKTLMFFVQKRHANSFLFTFVIAARAAAGAASAPLFLFPHGPDDQQNAGGQDRKYDNIRKIHSKLPI